jgi:DNA-binding beta-propeller fold protein YncE
VNRRTFLLGAAAALAAPAAAVARQAGGTPCALVTADLESRVSVVELSTGRVIRSIRTLPGPRSIEACGDVAVVAHTAAGTVTLVDALTLKVRKVLRGFGEPRYTASGASGLAYVSDSGRGEVVVLDPRRGRILGRVDVGGPARHVAVVDSTVWTALGTKAERVAVVDAAVPERPRLVRTFGTPWPAHDIGFCFAPGGVRAWVTSGDRGRLMLYDLRSGRLLRTLAADAPPQHVTFAGGRAYVTSGADGLLRMHRLDGRLLRTTAVPVGSYNVQEGWGVVLTPSLSQGTLSVVSAHGALLRRVEAARSSHDACFVMSR